MKKYIIVALVALFIFVYWRGTQAFVKKLGLNCNWNVFFVVCVTDTKTAKTLKNPSIIDIIKAGANFK